MYEHHSSHTPLKHPIFLLAILISTVSFNPVWSEENKMLVLDVSGSMWGQIEGKTKIEIAQKVLKDVVKDWPTDTQAGLIAYGHRKKGNCTDIEVVLPLGPLDVEKFGAVVNELTPRGKTPLSDAVRLGADELRFTEQKATVILISDGRETCDKDPCALGLELKKLGVDFTTHVIGFDVSSIDDQQGLRCLAKNTGGDFFVASTDYELDDALRKATKSKQTTEYPAVALLAPIEVKAGSDFSVDILAKEGLDGRVKLFAIDKFDAISYQRIQESKDRDYKTIRLSAPETAGKYILKFFSPDDKLELASRTIQVLDADIELQADHSALISSSIDVMLVAAPNHNGRIALYQKGETKPFTHLPVNTDSNGQYKLATLNTPSSAGEYVLKFETSADQVLAEKPLRIELADIVIDTAKSVPIATKITATVLAPAGIQGSLQLHPVGQNIALDSRRITSVNEQYTPIDFQLPAVPGEYEIRFLSLDNEVIAKTDLLAIEYDIGLKMPGKANSNEVVIITPFGPQDLLGSIKLESEEHDFISSAQSIETSTGTTYKPLAFKIPEKAGAYFFRFYTLRNELIMQQQLTVTD